MEKFKEAIIKIFAVIGTALVFSASAILKTCSKSVDDIGKIANKSLKAVDYGTVRKIADEPGEKLLKSSNLTSAGKSVSSTHPTQMHTNLLDEAKSLDYKKTMDDILEDISGDLADLSQHFASCVQKELQKEQENQECSKTAPEITSEIREDVVQKMLNHNGAGISFTWTLESATKFYMSGNMSKDEYITILGEYMRVFKAMPDEVIEAAKKAKW